MQDVRIDIQITRLVGNSAIRTHAQAAAVAANITVHARRDDACSRTNRISDAAETVTVMAAGGVDFRLIMKFALRAPPHANQLAQRSHVTP